MKAASCDPSRTPSNTLPSAIAWRRYRVVLVCSIHGKFAAQEHRDRGNAAVRKLDQVGLAGNRRAGRAIDNEVFGGDDTIAGVAELESQVIDCTLGVVLIAVAYEAHIVQIGDGGDQIVDLVLFDRRAAERRRHREDGNKKHAWQRGYAGAAHHSKPSIGSRPSNETSRRRMRVAFGSLYACR